MALLPLAALLFVLITLVLEAWPAIVVNGWRFFTSSGWQPGNAYGSTVGSGSMARPIGTHYGALPMIVGTLETSAIALIIGVPIAVGAALVLTEKLPPRIAGPIGFFLELLAGIPSVVIGLWGAVTLGPIIAHDIAPILANHLPRHVPVLDFFSGPTGNGEGLLVSGVILALMIVPIVAASTRDLLRQVPPLAKEGGHALGMTDWQTTRRITLPWIRNGVVGAVILGAGRALGETMAVAMVSGVVLGSTPHNLYDTMTTIAATIVSTLDSAFTDSTGFAVRTLAELALVLMVITLVVNVGARYLVRRLTGTALPVGRGI